MFEQSLLAEYLRRSYFALDGLWFVKVEERLDFAQALELDAAVWQVLAKIQARKTRELLGLTGNKLSDLLSALQLKFAAEEYTQRVGNQQAGRTEIEITACPWIELLRKSGREQLAAKLADAVCTTDFQGWANEFDPAISVTLPERRCDGAKLCRVVFESR